MKGALIKLSPWGLIAIGITIMGSIPGVPAPSKPLLHVGVPICQDDDLEFGYEM